MYIVHYYGPQFEYCIYIKTFMWSVILYSIMTLKGTDRIKIVCTSIFIVYFPLRSYY